MRLKASSAARRSRTPSVTWSIAENTALLRLEAGPLGDDAHALEALPRPLGHELRRGADRLEPLRDQLVAHLRRGDCLGELRMQAVDDGLGRAHRHDERRPG